MTGHEAIAPIRQDIRYKGVRLIVDGFLDHPKLPHLDDARYKDGHHNQDTEDRRKRISLLNLRDDLGQNFANGRQNLVHCTGVFPFMRQGNLADPPPLM